MTTTAKTKKFELTSFDGNGKVVAQTEYTTLDEMIDAMVATRDAEQANLEEGIKDITNRLIRYIGFFGYQWDVEFDDNFHGVEMAFKNTKYPLWSGALLETIAQFMGLSSNNGYGWTINHEGKLRIHHSNLY